MLRDLGADLGGVAVDGLLAAEDDVKLAFQLLHLLDGLADDVAGGQGVGTTKGPVADQIRLVGRDSQGLLQHGLRLLGTHGEHHDLGGGVGILDPGRGFQGIAVKRIQDGGDACADQGIGDRVDLDFRRIRHLLDAYKHVHWFFSSYYVFWDCGIHRVPWRFSSSSQQMGALVQSHFSHGTSYTGTGPLSIGKPLVLPDF